MHQKNELEQLKKVRNVEAPLFLYTRIQAKLSALEAEKTPVSWQVSGIFAVCLTLLLNIVAFQNILQRPSNTLDGVANSMQLNPNLQLYADTN